MPKAARVKRRRTRHKRSFRKSRRQRGGNIPDKYPGVLVTARGPDIEDPPVVMTRDAYLESTDREGESVP